MLLVGFRGQAEEFGVCDAIIEADEHFLHLGGGPFLLREGLEDDVLAELVMMDGKGRVLLREGDVRAQVAVGAGKAQGDGFLRRLIKVFLLVILEEGDAFLDGFDELLFLA